MVHMKPVHARGSVREMAAIALPMVVSMSCDTLMVFTDRVFLSRLGPEQMNAAMGGGLTAFMMGSFFIGLTGYVTALAAQYLGAGQKEKCAVVLFQAVIMACLAYIPILLCRPFAYGLFDVMGVPASQLVPQKVYFDILLYGVIFSLLRNALACFFSGVGQTGIVMVASAVAFFVNLGANYVLIFGKLGLPAFGIHGAAFGTLLGGLSGLLVLVFAYLRGRNWQEFSLAGSLRFDRTVFGKLLRFGSPAGIELFLNILAFNGLVLIFHSQGSVTATAATVVLNWDMVSFVPLIGVEIGVTSLVGRAMGGRDPLTAHRSVMAGFRIGLAYSAFILLLFLFFSRQMVMVFHPAGDAGAFAGSVPLAVSMIRAASVYVLVEAMFVVFIGALRGAGDTFWAMVLSVSLHWITTVVLFVVLRVLGWTPLAGWWFVVVMFWIFSFLVFWRYKSGCWKRIQMIEPDVPPVPRAVLHDGFPID